MTIRTQSTISQGSSASRSRASHARSPCVTSGSVCLTERSLPSLLESRQAVIRRDSFHEAELAENSSGGTVPLLHVRRDMVYFSSAEGPGCKPIHRFRSIAAPLKVRQERTLELDAPADLQPALQPRNADQDIRIRISL